MKDLIEKELQKFVLESKENWSEEVKSHYYDIPVIKYASATDPLFDDYKGIIGNGHLTPHEIFEMEFGPGSFHGGTVISISFPISEKIRISNRQQESWPSKEWVLQSISYPIFTNLVLKHVESYLTGLNYRTVAPTASKWYKQTSETSNWSERHIAYAAGHGTFCLNASLITEKGTAVFLVSFVTELELTPDNRMAKSYAENCQFFSKGICGDCIKRCPANAISKDGGYDKLKCWNYAYGEESKKLVRSYGGTEKSVAGCSLCRTNVPCEYCIPTNLT